MWHNTPLDRRLAPWQVPMRYEPGGSPAMGLLTCGELGNDEDTGHEGPERRKERTTQLIRI